MLFRSDITMKNTLNVSKCNPRGWRHGILTILQQSTNNPFVVGPRYATVDDSQFLVSGGVNSGESIESAACRELSEELGLLPNNINDLKHVKTVSYYHHTLVFHIKYDDLVISDNKSFNYQNYENILNTMTEEDFPSDYGIEVKIIFWDNKNVNYDDKLYKYARLLIHSQLLPNQVAVQVAVQSIISLTNMRPKDLSSLKFIRRFTNYLIHNNIYILDINACSPISQNYVKNNKSSNESESNKSNYSTDIIIKRKVSVIPYGGLSDCFDKLLSTKLLSDNNKDKLSGCTVMSAIDVANECVGNDRYLGYFENANGAINNLTDSTSNISLA